MFFHFVYYYRKPLIYGGLILLGFTIFASILPLIVATAVSYFIFMRELKPVVKYGLIATLFLAAILIEPFYFAYLKNF